MRYILFICMFFPRQATTDSLMTHHPNYKLKVVFVCQLYTRAEKCIYRIERRRKTREISPFILASLTRLKKRIRNSSLPSAHFSSPLYFNLGKFLVGRLHKNI